MSPNALLIRFRIVVDYLILNVIDTFQEWFRRWHFNWLVSKYGLRVLFLSLKLKWKYYDDESFMTTPMGLNKLCFIVDKLMTTFLHLKDKVLSYKICKSIGITHMEEEFVPLQYIYGNYWA